MLTPLARPSPCTSATILPTWPLSPCSCRVPLSAVHQNFMFVVPRHFSPYPPCLSALVLAPFHRAQLAGFLSSYHFSCFIVSNAISTWTVSPFPECLTDVSSLLPSPDLVNRPDFRCFSPTSLSNFYFFRLTSANYTISRRSPSQLCSQIISS